MRRWPRQLCAPSRQLPARLYQPLLAPTMEMEQICLFCPCQAGKLAFASPCQFRTLFHAGQCSTTSFHWSILDLFSKVASRCSNLPCSRRLPAYLCGNNEFFRIHNFALGSEGAWLLVRRPTNTSMLEAQAVGNLVHASVQLGSDLAVSGHAVSLAADERVSRPSPFSCHICHMIDFLLLPCPLRIFAHQSPLSKCNSTRCTQHYPWEVC